MSKTLYEILKEYRLTCFKVKDANLSDTAVDLMAKQHMVTTAQIKSLLLELIGEETHKYCDALNHPNPSCTSEIAQDKLKTELRKEVEAL